MIDPKSPIKQAKEVKVVVGSFQRPGVRKSLYVTFGAFLQGINAGSNFNQEFTDVCLDICRESNFDVILLSVAADGVSVEEKWILRHLCRFLRGKSDFLAVVDTNHNCQNGRDQFATYSSVMIMGFHMVDSGLFIFSGVPEEICRVKDWASDLLVLKTVSSDTVNKIVNLATTEDVGTV